MTLFILLGATVGAFALLFALWLLVWSFTMSQATTRVPVAEAFDEIPAPARAAVKV